MRVFVDTNTVLILKSLQILIKSTKKYPKIRDISDLPVLVSVILSDSDVLLAGDKDFEEVKIDKPLIFMPAKYFELIGN